MQRLLKRRLVCSLCVGLALSAASPSWALPAPVIDNERVTVRDLALVPGEPGVKLTHDHDYVILFLVGGGMRTSGTIETHKAGDAVYHHAGTEIDVAVSGHPRLVVVDLKDFRPAPLVNKTGYPLAFPRPGAKKVLENSKVTVWNYAWQPGKPTPMHYHDKDVVVVYRGGGTLDSVTPDGKHTLTAHSAAKSVSTKAIAVIMSF